MLVGWGIYLLGAKLGKVMDENTTISDLKDLVQRFVAAREWEPFHRSKHLAMSIAIEAAELMEHFQWNDADEGQALLAKPEKKMEISDELADILIYCISFANQADIDISAAVSAKLDRNEFRFPPVK